MVTKACAWCGTEFRGRAHQRFCSRTCGGLSTAAGRWTWDEEQKRNSDLESSKPCSHCKETKLFSEFHANRNARDGRADRCKVCASQARKEAYPAKRDAHLAKARERYSKDPKFQQRAINRARRRYYREYREIARKRDGYRERNRERLNAADRNRYQHRGRWLDEEKAKRGCLVCGERHPACLEFHHRDPETKVFNLSEGRTNGRWTIDEMEAEMAKCDCICANCHRKLHWQERQAKRATVHEHEPSPA